MAEHDEPADVFVAFGITGDYDSVPDINAMARSIEDEIVALRSLARRRKVAP